MTPFDRFKTWAECWSKVFFDFKTGLKHWSTWFWVGAVVLLGFSIELPNLILTYLPQLMGNLPPNWQQRAAFVLGVAGILSKAVKQDAVMARFAKIKAWLQTHAKSVSGAVTKKAAGASALLAAVAVLAVPALKMDEGLRTRPYLDAAKVVTVCYGHTGHIDPKAVYTPAQCSDMLNTDLGEHTLNALHCAPNLATDVNALAGWSRFDFNTGQFCSTKHHTMINARRSIAQGHIKASCAQMSPWVYVNGKPVTGLINRRARERAMCEKVTKMTFSLKAWLAIGALLWGIAAPTGLWLLYDHEHKTALTAKAEAVQDNAKLTTAISDYQQTQAAYDKTKKAYDDAMSLNASLTASRGEEQAKINTLSRSLQLASEAIKNAPGASDSYHYSDSLYSLMRGEAGSGQSGADTGSPAKATPQWTKDDFACASDPAIPQQATTKGASEAYTAEAITGLRECRTKLQARGARPRHMGMW